MPGLPFAIPALLKSRWLQIGVLALAVALLWLRGEHYRADRNSWRSAHAAQKQAVVAVAAAARARQMAADVKEFSLKSELAEKANDASRLAQGTARAAVAAYAAAHPDRLRAEAAGAAACGTATPGVPGDPAAPAGGNGAAQLVAIPRSDLDALAAAALQGAISQRYLKALVDGGWAVPGPETGALITDP